MQNIDHLFRQLGVATPVPDNTSRRWLPTRILVPPLDSFKWIPPHYLLSMPTMVVFHWHPSPLLSYNIVLPPYSLNWVSITTSLDKPMHNYNFNIKLTSPHTIKHVRAIPKINSGESSLTKEYETDKGYTHSHSGLVR
jgi:hypothetical protein